MAKVEILVVCSNQGILDTIIRLVNNNPNWNCTGAADLEQATNLLIKHSFDLVLLGSGLSDNDERQLQLAVISSQKNIAVIKHYGGGSGLLFGEIFDALASLNK